jgi:RNA polymerase sigma factor (TIGR02999 family)
MHELTQILTAIERGDAQAAESLLPLVYAELRRLAAQRLAGEKPGQTLEATALVHEAYLRLVGSEDPGWNSRGHFYAAAAEAMRRILVENARRKAALKHGGPSDRIDLDLDGLPDRRQGTRFLDLAEALETLEARDSEAAQVVKLRFFAGLSITEVAGVMGVSPRKVNGLWAYARAWLLRRLRETRASSDRPAEEASTES